jgi:tetratricopeptide (TPR) repeat protein/tRNA A-37 threonylcarbamoyl transferase component Bud32
MSEQPDPKDIGIGESSWDRGMRAAYAKRQRTAARARGSSVMLRDDESDPAPLVKVGAADPQTVPDGEGRYQVVGEIARGGIGVVLKSRDLDLGRDVAMKVLRDEHVANPDVVERFVEEAQIGGQLQHPGIVPVYEMGRGTGKRPFFTMKLVKGRTLSALLSTRKEPAEERRRFLSIFEAVCMAIAYAHARGVIHRDLKPSNVMVGAFGEVQVVDWGLAKVLTQGGVADERKARQETAPDVSVVETVRSGSGSSQSQVGSVMGTPAYMPPEQARGDIDRIDERSDVFALGAVLCEILTGKPPYEGTDREMVLQAAQAKLEPALARLAACGADAELVAIAEHCLTPSQQGRPAHAGVVATAVAKYLTSVEERARASELAAVEARAKAAEEKRARRLTMALASVVLAAVVLGGGGYAIYRADAASRQAETARAVAQAADEATLLRGKAAAHGDAALWLEALSAAKNAETLAHSRDADPATREKVATLLAEIESEAAKASAAAKQVAIDRAMVARLEETCAAVGDELDYARADASYAEAFRDYGIDPYALDHAAAVARVRASAIAVPLALALEDWATAKRKQALTPHTGNESALLLPNASSPPNASAERLERIAAEADPDPFRTRLRSAKDRATLQALAAEAQANPAAIPAISLARLGTALEGAGDRADAIELFRAAQRLHPDDFWINLGARFPLARGGRSGDAVQFTRAALAIRPRSVEARIALGTMLQGLNRNAEAEEAYRDALAIQPNNGHCCAHLASVLNIQGKHEEALETIRRANTLAPKDGWAWQVLFVTLAHLGRLDEAEAEARRAVAADPDDAGHRSNLAYVLRNKGDSAGALEQLREAVRLAPEADQTETQLGKLLHESGDDEGARAHLERAVQLNPWQGDAWASLCEILRWTHDIAAYLDAAREAVRQRPDDAHSHYLLGLALQIKGDFDGSIAAYRAALRLNGDHAMALCNLGLLLRGHARYAEAIELLRRGNEIGSRDREWRYPTADWLQHTRRLAAADAKFGPVMRHEIEPSDAEECLLYAEVCHGRGLDASAVSLAERAFAAEPGRVTDAVLSGVYCDPSPDVYNAACYAAKAGTGRSADAYLLDDTARAAMRARALAWARASVDAGARGLAKADEKARSSIGNEIWWWIEDRDLDGVRDESALARLPAGEQQAWRALWADLRALAAKAGKPR